MAIRILGQDGFGWATTPSKFEQYWVQVYNNAIITIGDGPDGNGRALRLADTGGSWKGILKSTSFTATNKLCMEAHFLFESLGNDEICRMYAAGSASLTLALTTTGQLIVYNIHGTLATSAASIVAGNWYKIQWQVVVSKTVGAVQVWVNGAKVIDLSNVYTSYWDNETVDAVFYGIHSGVGATQLANPIWYNFDTIGTDRLDAGCWIRTVRYDAGGAHNDSTPNTGTRVAAINDTDPDADTTFDYTVANGERQTFAIAPLGLTVPPVAVCAKHIGRKDSSGTAALTPSIRSGGADYDGDSTAQSTSYQCFGKTWTVNPATGNPFTPAEIDALEGGWLDSR